MGSSSVRSGSLGVSLTAADPHEAAALEALGVETVWVAGGSLDTLSTVGALVAATDHVPIATGIVPLGVYDLEAVAALHRRVPAGRLLLGLGGPQQPRAMAALNASLDELDAAGVGPDDRLLAALGPRKLALARERAAEAIALLVPPAFTRSARDAVGPSRSLVVHQVVVPATDRDAARAAAEPMLRFLTGVGGYRANFRRLGLTDDDVDDLSPALVDAAIAWGDADAITARLHAHRAAGADQVVLTVVPAGGVGTVELAREVLARWER